MITSKKPHSRLKTMVLIFVLSIATPALAWMGGGMDRGMMRGGGMCRMMDVTPQPVDPANLPESSSPGAQVLKSKCTQCHGLVSPRQHASKDWPYIVDRMDRRMRMMAGGGMGMMRSNIQPLTQEEENILLSYLQQNAFRAMETSNLPNNDAPEAQSFKRICSQCHALPDPSAYSSEEWKSIVARMAVNMENMGFGSITKGQKEAILEYLEKNAHSQ